MGIPIIAGYGSNNKCIETFVDTCPFCGQKTTLKVYETSNNVNVYFVPVAKFNKHYYLVCHLCDKSLELSKEEKQELLDKIQNLREIPAPRVAPPAPPPQKPQLPQVTTGIRLLTGKLKDRQFAIETGKSYTVGKDANIADICLDAAYNMVSRVHCTITYDAKFDKYFVIDCSSNGTFFENGTRLAKNARTPVPRGTVLKLANDNCRIKLI